MRQNFLWRRLRGLSAFMLVLLLIEFLDELAYGIRETAWPFVRSDLGLSYAEIGLVLSIPVLFSVLFEPILGVLSDIGAFRRRIVLLGGVLFAISLVILAASQGFEALLFGSMLSGTASGMFVSLGQAVLMDIEPSRHEQNMARWTLAGSIGVVIAPWLLSGLMVVGSGWRGAYLICAVLLLIAWLLARRFRFPVPAHTHEDEKASMAALKEGFRDAFRALKRKDVLRWLILLDFSDLMLDVLLGYLALYFVDVVGTSETEAALAITVWTGVGLIGDVLIIPLLDRVRGVHYLRISAVIVALLYPLFLLIPDVLGKLIVLGLLGIFNAGWYSVLQAGVYSSLPGRSGTAAAASSIFGAIGGLLPFGLGVAAEAFGLGNAMWILLLGPLVLIIGIPRHHQQTV